MIARRDARHAYAVLRGLTSSSGGMVAAATTSLPERAGAGRNYDYRYVWIRDQCFVGQAVAADGAHPRSISASPQLWASQHHGLLGTAVLGLLTAGAITVRRITGRRG